MAARGLQLIVPTSVSGASVSATGVVTSSGVSNFTVNGVFSATYRNYLLLMSMHNNTIGENLQAQWTVSGTPATGTDYARQYISGLGSTEAASRSTGADHANIGYISSGDNFGFCNIYAPYLTEYTMTRSCNFLTTGVADPRRVDVTTSHALSTSYDGVKIFSQLGGNFGGTFWFYGFVD